jgi:3-oxoisoapionate decarboxylase
MRFGLTISGAGFSTGTDPHSPRTKAGPIDVVEQAVQADLEGVELPVGLLRSGDVSETAAAVRERGLFLNVAASGYDADKLAEVIRFAGELGAGTVRTVVGGAGMGGDRRPLAGRWQEFLGQVLEGFRGAAAYAESAGIDLAVENHQDLASEELLWLCETIDSPRFGITLDTANPLATAEEPLDFVRRVAPFVKNVHLKDYWVYLSEAGYRLVRCPLGRGITEFREMLRILAPSCPDVTMSLELGALEARHVRVFADDFWPDYPPRSAAQLAAALRVVHEHARVGGDWRTPFEQGRSAEEIIAYEERQLSESLAFVDTLRARYGGASCRPGT